MKKMRSRVRSENNSVVLKAISNCNLTQLYQVCPRDYGVIVGISFQFGLFRF